MTPDQNKAFSDMRKGGQVLEATQGIEDFLKEQGHAVHKETVIDECKRAYEIGRNFAQDGKFFKKDGVPAELIELLKTAKTDRVEIERSYTDGKLSVIEEAQE